MAAFKDQNECIELLLKKGAQIDSQNYHGYTALHTAAEKGNKAGVLLLLTHGADKTIKDKEGKTALDLAQQRNRHKVVKLLSSNRKRKGPVEQAPQW